MRHYDKIFIGTGPISVIDALLAAKSGQSVLLIDEKSAIGGAWGTIQVGDYGKLEIGCHIWSYNKKAYQFMKDFFQLDLIELNPQPYFLKGKTRLSYDRKNALITLNRAGSYLRSFDLKGLIDFIRNNPSVRIPIFKKKYLYPKGGARDFQNVLAEKVTASGIKTILDRQIVEIRKKGDLWKLTTEDGEVFETTSIRLTSTSSIKRFYYQDKSFEITHKFVNYSHYHLVIKGGLLKPCSYVRVLGNEIIHRLCDITYQLGNEVTSDVRMLLVGFFDDESTTKSEAVILSNIKQFLIDNKFVNSSVEIIYAQKNRFTTSYIPKELGDELSALDDTIELLNTTDLMYGIHYKLEEWDVKIKA